MNRRTALQALLAASAGFIFSRRLVGDPRDDGPQAGHSQADQSQADRPQTDEGIYKLRSDVRLVLLDVSVKDSQGNFVTGLSKENFSVLENDHLQPITVFDPGDVPITVGLLVDESRSMTPKRLQVLAAAETFVAESNRQDEVFVLNFNDRVMPGLPGDVLFSDNVPQLRAALHRGVPEGKTALHDAVVAGLQQLELGQRDKKALVVISDGGDNASKHNRRETLALVERSIATIYAVGLFDPDDPDRDPAILRRLAQISGGEAYFPERVAEMAPICRRIAKEIRTRYSIGYLPPFEKRPRSFRSVTVRAAAPGHGRLMVRTRDGYRYDAAAEQKK